MLHFYVSDANGARTPRPSRHNLSSAKPNCLSLFQPRAEKIFNILGGIDERMR